MLTAVTTILGLVPMALGILVDFSSLRLVVGGSTAEWWGPMAVAVIFGLAFATILTLVMVPTFYSIADGFKEKMGWQKERAVTVQGVPMMVIEAPDAAGMEEQKSYENNVARVEALAADLLGSLGRRKNQGRFSDDDTDEGGA